MIFEDPSHRRWRRAIAVFALLVVAALTALAFAVAGIIVPPHVPNIFSERPEVKATLVQASLEHDPRPIVTPQEQKRLQVVRAQERKRRSKLVSGKTGGPMPLPAGAVVGFTTDDPKSVASLERHIANLDVVVPSWFELPGAGCELVETIDEKTRRILGRGDAVVLPRLANLAGDQWRGAETSKFLADDHARECLVKKVVDRLAALGAGGINLDLEELQPEDSEPFLELIVALRAALHAKAMRLTVDVPFHDPAFDFEYIGDVADAVMVMAYDQHYPASNAGPIASKVWLDESLDEMLPRLPPDRVVVVLGSYGYDWTIAPAQKRAEDLSFRGAMELARAADALPVFEEVLENGHFGYREDGATHEVWFQDALAAWNQIARLKTRQVTRVGLWRLGTEDETLWSFMGLDAPPTQPTALSAVAGVGTSSDVARLFRFIGDGETFSKRGQPQPGTRDMVTTPDGLITRASYTSVPSGFVVERRGNSPKKVVLTFDDGPDEKNTGRLLDALHDLGVSATFFVVGDQAKSFPELVERESAEGHLVGNHSSKHKHMDTLTPDEAADDLRSNQRLIEGLTGRRAPLFRAPYTATIDTESNDDLAALRLSLTNGYVFVGANIDPNDWRPEARGEEVASKVVADVLAGKGHIVLLHDGGGDRTATIDAVKRLVPALRGLGYQIVSLDQLLDVKREEIASVLPPGERMLSGSNALMAHARGWGWTALAALFFVCTLLSIVRITFLGGLTLKNLSAKPPEPAQPFAPLVTVIVPAYNEAKVIATTLRSLLASTYANLEILVVDDGSTDATAEVVERLAEDHPCIRLIRQANAGKAKAANRALATARGEIVVAVDADTVVAPDSVPKLVAHFASPDVTAVCGNVEVGNVNGIFTAFQAIEYVTSQNFDRRAFSALNCISVVPGALGAWRREAVLAAGGYSDLTLTEDADLTLTILENGGRVVYEPEAYGKTEAPESLGALLRQRFRWTYGTYQCLYKHRSALFHGTLGWVGLPNMFVFQVIFPLLSPVGDIMMVLSIWRGDWRAFLAGYIAFLAMDICGSLLAFTLDRKPLKWLPLLLIQRFSYRQIMYYVCFKAMIAAVRGARHGWRKLDRTGSVTRQSEAVTT